MYNSISPSVYAIFTGLSALNLCGPVGATYALESFTFGPSELSTSSYITDASLPAEVSVGNWTAINYADFGSFVSHLYLPSLSFEF